MDRNDVIAYEPWIGGAANGARRVVAVSCTDGVMRYVTVRDMLTNCTLYETAECAEAALNPARAGTPPEAAK